MIDLHTHTLLSDGELLPSELVRRAVAKGYEAIALTDHADFSVIDFVIPRIVKVSKELSRYWPIKVIPGIEITHVPLEDIGRLIRYARRKGAAIVVVHGETVSEPVLAGTNRAAIENKADILAHPGLVSEEDAALAAKNGVYLEITTRVSHAGTNDYVKRIASGVGAKLVLNTDTHKPENLLNDEQARQFLETAGFTEEEIRALYSNSHDMAGKGRT
jgi:histidinol phosphatase-like PHP family hydrolase